MFLSGVQSGASSYTARKAKGDAHSRSDDRVDKVDHLQATVTSVTELRCESVNSGRPAGLLQHTNWWAACLGFQLETL